MKLSGVRKHIEINIDKASLRDLLRIFLKGLILLIFYFILLIVKYLEKVSNYLMSTSYGILKPCHRCVYGKSRETLIIISAKGYSRDNEALVVMNYKGKNYYRTGECIGYSKCGKCLDVIDKNLKLQCKWTRIG